MDGHQQLFHFQSFAKAAQSTMGVRCLFILLAQFHKSQIYWLFIVTFWDATFTRLTLPMPYSNSVEDGILNGWYICAMVCYHFNCLVKTEHSTLSWGYLCIFFWLSVFKSTVWSQLHRAISVVSIYAFARLNFTFL